MEVNAPSVLDSINRKNAAQAADAAPTADETEDRFLKLLVAQMRNQDPLNPLDNAEVTTQLAQINTVRGIERMNTSMQDLLAMYESSERSQAVALLGRDVLSPGSQLKLKEGSGWAGFELGAAAENVVVEILDGSGKVLRSEAFEALDKGVHVFEWDGAADDGGTRGDGSYVFVVRARNGEVPVIATPLSSSKVEAVVAGEQGVRLELDGGDKLGYDDVKAIF